MPEEKGTSSVEFKKSAIRFLITVGVCFLIFKFIIPSYVVREESMVPTMYEGDRILLNVFSEPKREDIVIFSDSDYGALIKRVIAEPKDKCVVKDGALYVNGKFTEKDSGIFKGEFTVPKDKYIVMGDNRSVSLDSRAFGYVSRERFKGKVLVRMWPLNKVGLVK